MWGLNSCGRSTLKPLERVLKRGCGALGNKKPGMCPWDGTKRPCNDQEYPVVHKTRSSPRLSLPKDATATGEARQTSRVKRHRWVTKGYTESCWVKTSHSPHTQRPRSPSYLALILLTWQGHSAVLGSDQDITQIDGHQKNFSFFSFFVSFSFFCHFKILFCFRLSLLFLFLLYSSFSLFSFTISLDFIFSCE